MKVLPLEDGGNPREAGAIRETARGFLITPFSEDGDPNYKFRLDVELVHEAAGPAATRFTIEWGDEEYSRFRRYVLLSQGGLWQRLPAEIEATRAIATVPVPPGRSHLGMHPPYNCGRLEALVQGLGPKVFRVRSAGRSLHGREILALEAGPQSRRPLVVMARAHPYETVGSFMLEGMIQWLEAGSSEARALLAAQRLVLLPMPNPDGVAEGCCKRTAGGLDLNEAAASDEPEGVALTVLFRELRPRATFDIHGFMHKNDGFGASDAERGREVHEALVAQPAVFDKKLGFQHAAEPEGGRANLGGLAQHEFGSARFGGAFAWFDRDEAHLARMGVALLRAFAAEF